MVNIAVSIGSFSVVTERVDFFFLSLGPIPGRFVPLNLNEGLDTILDLKIDRGRGDCGRSSGDLV